MTADSYLERAKEIKRRVQAAAGGQVEDLNEVEHRAAMRLSKIWKDGEPTAGVRVIWIRDRHGVHFGIRIRRADGTIEALRDD